MNLHISEDIKEMSDYAAEWMVDYIKEVLERKESFYYCPFRRKYSKKIIPIISYHDKYQDKIDWNKVAFFLGG